MKSPYVWSAKCIKGPDGIYKTIHLTTLTPYVITKQLTKKNITNRNQRQPQTTSSWLGLVSLRLMSLDSPFGIFFLILTYWELYTHKRKQYQRHYHRKKKYRFCHADILSMTCNDCQYIWSYLKQKRCACIKWKNLTQKAMGPSISGAPGTEIDDHYLRFIS